jgi:hypothetical protein
MAQDQKYWDPDQVDVIVSGFTMSGFADNSMIEFEEDGDRFSEVDGIDGTMTRSKKMVRKATLTIHLQNTSNSNDILTALLETDLSTPGGAGVVAGLIRDKNGATVYAISKMWVMALPKDEMSDKATDRAWKLRCTQYKAFLGGS